MENAAAIRRLSEFPLPAVTQGRSLAHSTDGRHVAAETGRENGQTDAGGCGMPTHRRERRDEKRFTLSQDRHPMDVRPLCERSKMRSE